MTRNEWRSLYRTARFHFRRERDLSSYACNAATAACLPPQETLAGKLAESIRSALYHQAHTLCRTYGLV